LSIGGQQVGLPLHFSHCTVGLTVALAEVERYFREPALARSDRQPEHLFFTVFSGAEVIR